MPGRARIWKRASCWRMRRRGLWLTRAMMMGNSSMACAWPSALLNPAGDSLRIPLQQTAPGRYEATFVPQNEGAYFLTISGEAQLSAGTTNLTDLNGWVMSYSPEYIPRPHDERTLAEIAEITGGRNLAEKPEDVFAHDLGERQAATDIWERLVLLA